MRMYRWLAAAAVAAAFAAPGQAQSVVTFGGNNNQTITYKVINPSQPGGPIASQQGGLFSGSKLMGFFHWPSQRSTTPVVGSSTFPTSAQLPNASYLQGFGFKVGGQ